MNIHNIQIERIKPYGRNPRKNDQAVDAVAASIQEFGFRVPLLIDKNNVIVAGHTRYKAAKKLGMNELPCIIADDLTPTQVKAYRIMDNKATEMAKWDEALLNQEFESLIASGFDLNKTGFATYEIEFITGDMLDDGFDTPFGKETHQEQSDNNGYHDHDKHEFNNQFAVVISCKNEEEKQAMASILGLTGELKEKYTMEEIEGGQH